MKKLFFLMIVLAAVATTGYSQTAPAANADLAVASFDAQNFDFGKIKQGAPVTHEFKFTNTGKVPMIITNVQASCGCTTPDWSKDPVPPGGKGFIKATYNAASVGAFNKAVTVTANIPNGSVQLFIKGEVSQTPVSNK
ncbi:MAG TPA: DUF1573 domain-containing protein [Cyclobacteriaceae bacterium]|nr:DUF1573 domain-containing protein [Cyclobacteriaceae bacterium]